MSEKIADDLHAFIAAAPHKYPGHLIELFDRAEKALRRCSADSAPMRSMTPQEEEAVQRSLLASGTPLYDLPQASAESDDAAIAQQIGAYLGLYSIDTKDVAYIRGVLNVPQTAPIGYVSQATLRLLSERGQAGHICPVPAYDTLIPVYAGPVQQSQAENVALQDARDEFEAIRLLLINDLAEPGRSAFWKAVNARDKIAALSRHQRGGASASSPAGSAPSQQLHE
jgi:predicted DNA-binding protein (UPF0251 family)